MKDEELDQYFWNDRRDFLDYDNKVPKNSIRTVEKAKNQPEQLKDNRPMWKKAKAIALKMFKGTLKDLFYVKLNGSFTDGGFKVSAIAKFDDEYLFSFEKEWKK